MGNQKSEIRNKKKIKNQKLKTNYQIQISNIKYISKKKAYLTEIAPTQLFKFFHAVLFLSYGLSMHV